jgi:hypothetical protein
MTVNQHDKLKIKCKITIKFVKIIKQYTEHMSSLLITMLFNTSDPASHIFLTAREKNISV